MAFTSIMSDTPVSFRSRILASVKLSSLQFLSRIGLRLVSTVVLTRLLAPEIYGVFAVVLVYRYILELISDLGLRSVILTNEEKPDDTFLKVCWSLSLMRGTAILMLSCCLGMLIFWLQNAGVFPEDSAYMATTLPLAIPALGISSFISGFISMNLYATERDMKFGKVTIGTIASNVAGLIVTIGLAYIFRSVWALVFGAVAQTLVLVIYSHFAFEGPRMRPAMERKALKIIFARAKWIIGHSGLTAASQAADRLMLGFVTASATFGYYYIARQVLELVNTFLNSIHMQMGLQVFTHILKTPESFRKNYYRYRLFYDVPAGLAAGGLFILAPILVDIVFDDRFANVAPIIQILVFALLLLGPLTLREAYSAERRFREMTLLSIVSAATLWSGLLVTTLRFDSFEGALYVIALYRTPEVFLLYLGAFRRRWFVWWREALIPVIFAIGAGLGWLVELAWFAVTA